MQQVERFSTLLHTVYEGATNPAAWSNILADVSEWLGSEKGLLITSALPLEKGGFAYTYSLPQSDIALWSTIYADKNVWLHAMVERRYLSTSMVFTGTDLIPDEKLFESEWYQSLLEPSDILHLLAGLVYGLDQSEIPLIALCAFRGRMAAQFNEEERAKMRLVIPHMSRAMGVMFKLRDAEFRVAASLHALNQVRTGILLLDAVGHVCFANTEAERVCRLEDGLRLKAKARSHSTLHADDPNVDSITRHVLRSTVQIDANDIDHFSHAICVKRPSGLPSYSVQVSALPKINPYQLGHSMPSAIVFIKDSAQVAKPSGDLLARNYGLTPAEVRVALALCDGGSLEVVASELMVGVNTVKSHVKSVYSKMSVNNRAALTKLLVSLGSH